ncbi:hypothetical protein ACS2UV_27080, partial [Bacillus cereus group sp. BC328]
MQVGDCLTWKGTAPAVRRIPEYHGLSMPDSGCHLPIVLGSQIASFSGRGLFRAFNQPWKVDNRADRMGIRLTGQPLLSTQGGII